MEKSGGKFKEPQLRAGAKRRFPELLVFFISSGYLKTFCGTENLFWRHRRSLKFTQTKRGCSQRCNPTRTSNNRDVPEQRLLLAEHLPRSENSHHQQEGLEREGQNCPGTG